MTKVIFRHNATSLKYLFIKIIFATVTEIGNWILKFMWKGKLLYSIGRIQQEGLTGINIYAPNTRSANFIKQNTAKYKRPDNINTSQWQDTYSNITNKATEQKNIRV